MNSEQTPKNLSDIIRAQKDVLPDHNEEWEKAKKLIKTLNDSGAPKLLEQLFQRIMADSILSEPAWGEDVFHHPMLSNLVIFRNTNTISVARAANAASRSLEKHPVSEGIKFNPIKAEGYMDLSKLPLARSTLFYNPHNVYNPPISKPTISPRIPGFWVVLYNLLEVECYEEGTVIIGNEGRRKSTAILNVEKNTQAIDKALGGLYGRQPALPLAQRK